MSFTPATRHAGEQAPNLSLEFEPAGVGIHGAPYLALLGAMAHRLHAGAAAEVSVAVSCQ